MISSFLENKKCDICGSNDFRVKYKWPANYYPHDKYETASWDGRQNIELSIVKCLNCKVLYTRPSFKENNLDLVYPLDSVNSGSINYNKLLTDKKWQDIISKVKAYLPNKKLSIVDIGARYGVLTKQLELEGYINSFGVEYNQNSVELAVKNGVKLYQGLITTIPSLLGSKLPSKINAFIMDDVLEHLAYPSRDLEILSNCQEKGDYLFLRQMDTNSLGHKLFRKKWYYLQPAAHMYFFDKRNVKKLLSYHNYDIVDIYKYPNVKNFILTITMSIFRRLKNSNSKWITNNGKIMYLNQRRKSVNDMFLVIAKKK